MSNIISVTDFRSQVSETINRVHFQNETVFLTRGNTVVAKLVGISPNYPYAKELKAAAASAHNAFHAAALDFLRISIIVGYNVKLGAQKAGSALKGVSLLIFRLLKRWLGIAFNVEKEISKI